MFRKAMVVWFALAAGFVASAAGASASGASASSEVERPAVDVEAEAAERERRINERTERARREAQFNQLDADGDGYLTMAELRAMPELTAEPDVLDRDQDGRVSRTEFAALELSSEDGNRGEGSPSDGDATGANGSGAREAGP